jgi:integrase
MTVIQQAAAFAKLPAHLRDICEFLTLVGCRISEALTVKVKDFDFDRKIVTFSRTWSGRKIKENTKTNKPRVFPLSDLVIEIIKRNLNDRIGEAYLFCKPCGTPYTSGHLRGVWKATGLTIPSKDATRRSWAIRMRNAGVPIPVIQKGLAHSSIRTTEIYLDEGVSGPATYSTSGRPGPRPSKSANRARETKRGSKSRTNT